MSKPTTNDDLALAIKKGFDGVDKRFDTIESDLCTVKEDVADIKQHLGTIEDSFAMPVELRFQSRKRPLRRSA